MALRHKDPDLDVTYRNGVRLTFHDVREILRRFEEHAARDHREVRRRVEVQADAFEADMADDLLQIEGGRVKELDITSGHARLRATSTFASFRVHDRQNDPHFFFRSVKDILDRRARRSFGPFTVPILMAFAAMGVLVLAPRVLSAEMSRDATLLYFLYAMLIGGGSAVLAGWLGANAPTLVVRDPRSDQGRGWHRRYAHEIAVVGCVAGVLGLMTTLVFQLL